MNTDRRRLLLGAAAGAAALAMPSVPRAQHGRHGQGGGASRGPENQMTAIDVHRTTSRLDHLA